MAMDPDAAGAAKAGLWRLVTLRIDDGREPPADLDDPAAAAAWVAATAPWHPALLAKAADLPQIEAVPTITPPGPNEVRLFPDGDAERLPSGFLTQAADAGTVVVETTADRGEAVRALLAKVDPAAAIGPDPDPIADDFHALGAAHAWLRDLTTAMGHVDGLDRTSLAREVLAGARAWADGDHAAASGRLRAAFELLTQARERFYPVDAYFVDLTLLDPSAPAGVLADALEARAPATFVATATAIEAQADRDPDRMAALREAITEGWADVVGGPYAESPEALLPVESVLWQFRHGGIVYRRHLDRRNVETLATRRFALYPSRPGVAKRFQFRFALYFGLDAGRFPVPPEAKRLWEAPDGSHLEAITRPPIAADRDGEGVRLPWRLARSMRDDHVATVVLAHWPGQFAGWYRDLRRVAAYSPVLARWVTAHDYFHRTDRPFEMYRPEADRLAAPYLAQAVARRDPDPISRLVEHMKLRAQLDAVAWLGALVHAFSPPAAVPHAPEAAPDDEPAPADPKLAALEDALELGRREDARVGLGRREPAAAEALARIVAGGAGGGRPGFLVVNPLSVARRAAVILPGASPDLLPEGPLRGAQVTRDGVAAVVDLPAFGFAWVPKEPGAVAEAPARSAVSARDRTLANESIEVTVDEATGGLRSVRAPGEPTARLGQQLVIAGLEGGASSRMRAEGFEIDHAGPTLAQGTSRGVLLGPDDRPLARFAQRLRLWTGRPTLELDITLMDLDPAWLRQLESADPWSSFLACRWAWPDPAAMLRRLVWHEPQLTESSQPETPEGLDISTRRQRTALLFGGLAHHQRHGTRMLDTLLLAGSESARTFRLGIALDLEHPHQAALDLTAPCPVAPVDSGPPAAGPAGWLFRLDPRSVVVTRVEALPPDPDEPDRGPALAFHVLETAGRPARGRLHTPRNPSRAQLTDFTGEAVMDLSVDGDAVLLDLTPHELARVVVVLG